MLSQLIRYAPVISLIERVRPRSILEVGCGSQGLGRFLPCLFVGMDRTFSDYTEMERRPSPWMVPVRGDGTRLPFGDDRLDLLVLLDILEHVPPRARPQILGECHRVARHRITIGFPSGEPAAAHDRELHRWLCKHRRPIPGWLNEHLEHPFPAADEVVPLFLQAGARAQVLKNGWLPAHRFLMRWENMAPYARYSAALSDLLAPTAWDWRNHRRVTNLLRRGVRPLWRFLPLLDRAPAYRELIIVEKSHPRQGSPQDQGTQG